MKRTIQHFALLLLPIFILSCASSEAPYDRHATRSQKFGDATVRYTSMVGGAAGGYFVGTELGKSYGGNDKSGVMGGALGAIVGGGMMYGINKYFDGRRMRDYQAGLEDGSAMARSELLVEQWKREAIYGLPPEGAYAGNAPMVRNVYVPRHVVNGVILESGNQQVMLP